MFDFTPAELLAARSTDGYYHLGDLDLRLRDEGATDWKGYSTALAREPVRPLPIRPGELVREDLKPTLPSDFPLQITRVWAVTEGKLALRFILRNSGGRAIEVGGLVFRSSSTTSSAARPSPRRTLFAVSPIHRLRSMRATSR
ncbi:MAG TPA: DUF5695 domain-containing protein [Terracidiphilus sp.]